MYGIIQERWR